MPEPPQNPDWPEAIATVLECRYDVRAGRALAFGLPSGKHFRIRYNYFANGEHHTGEFFSAKPIPQHTLFPIRYDPDLPTNHTHPQTVAQTLAPPPRRVTLAVGILGSVILSLAWLLILHSCH